MKKLVKYSLIVGAALLVLIIAAAILAPYLLNVDALRSWGEEKASATLGRKVTIEDVGFSWAGPKVRLSGFSIAEAEGFGEDPFARFDSFDLKMRLADLFRFRLSVEHVILNGPKIRILRNASGRFNFDDILDQVNRSTAVAQAPLAAVDPGADSVKAPPIDLLVEQILMDAGEVFFADASSPRLAKGITLAGIGLRLKDLSLDRPVTIEASLGLGRSGKDLAFEGTVGPVGRAIVPGRIPFDLNLTLLPMELTRVAELVGPLPVELSGTLSASETVRGSLEGGIAFESEGDLGKLGVKRPGGGFLVKGFDGAVKQQGRLDVKGKNLFLDGFTLTAYQAVFNAAGEVRNLGASPSINLSVSSNPIPLAGWDEVLPDLGPMVKLAGDLTFTGKVRGTYGRNLTADLALASERFEADRGPALMARSSSKAVAPPIGQEPLQPIKAPPITVNGEVTVKQGRFERIEFSDLVARLSQKNTLFSLDEMRLSAFSGLMAGSAWTDLGTLPLAYGTSLKMTGVQVNDALAAVVDMEGVLYGTATMDVTIEGKGTQYADLEKHLSGRGAMKASDGRITTANLGGGAAKAASLLGIGDESGETKFEDMDVSFTIADGKVKVTNMRIATGEYSLRAQGDIGLDQSLDMTSRMTLSQEATARIPEERRRLFPREKDGRVQLPLKIGGKVTSPKIGLDSSAMNEAAKEEVKKEVQQKKEDLKEKIQKGLGDKLKKLF